MSSSGGAYNFNTGFGITSLSSPTTSLFNAPIAIRGSSLAIVVASGATSGTDLAISGAITTYGGGNGNSSLVKSGPGTLLLNGINLYTGATTVSDGKLEMVPVAVLQPPLRSPSPPLLPWASISPIMPLCLTPSPMRVLWIAMEAM